MAAANPLLDPAARLVIAHRGNRIAVAENTMESLTQARDLGADAIEFDVRLTRDGVPVVIHDARVDRTTDGEGRVSDLTFRELEKLDAGARAPSRTGGRLSIPSLEEALDRFRAELLVIEVKELRAAEATDRLIRAFGAHDRVLIGSSDGLVMDRFYRSGLRACASMSDAAFMIPIALAGLTPGKPAYDVLSITPTFRGFRIPVVKMAQAALRAGVATHVWTVNEPAEARRLWAGGVAGVVTDDPAAMLRARAA